MADPRETEKLLKLHQDLCNLQSSSDSGTAYKATQEKKAVTARLYDEHNVPNIERAKTDLGGMKDEKGRPVNWYGDDKATDRIIANMENKIYGE